MHPAVLLLGILWWSPAVIVVFSAALEDYSLTIVPNEYEGKLIFLGAYVHLEVHGNGPHTGPEARSADGAVPVLTSSTYSLSPEMDTYPEARENCIRYTQGKGTLVKIETQEEDQKIQDFLLERQTHIKHPESFWTDGISNRTGHWKWNSNSALMDYKHFGNQPGAGGIMTFRSISEDREDFEWVAVYDRNERHYFICEVEPENVPMPCYEEIDLVIVLDSSTSVGIEDYNRARRFVAKLATAFRSPSRVALITYAYEVKVRIGLDKHWAPHEIENEVLNHPYEGGGTFTGGGIEEAMEQLHKYWRPGVGQRMVVLTDGESTAPDGPNGPIEDDYTFAKEYTAAAAAKANASNIGMFSVGIGVKAKEPNFQAELLTIAGGADAHRFTVDDFELLFNQIRAISIKICSNSP